MQDVQDSKVRGQDNERRFGTGGTGGEKGIPQKCGGWRPRERRGEGCRGNPGKEDGGGVGDPWSLMGGGVR